MRRSIVASSVLALAVTAFASTAYAGEPEEDEEYEEEEAQPKAKGDGKVQVIIVDEDDVERPRRKRRGRAAGPRRMTPIDGEDPPAGYHVERSTYRGVWIAGISTWGASYLVTLLSGAIADVVENHGDGKYSYYSLIPVAGPFVIAGHDEIQGPGKIPFVFLGLVQTAGMGMFIGGLAAKKEVWVKDSASMQMPEPEVYVGLGSVGLRQQF